MSPHPPDDADRADPSPLAEGIDVHGPVFAVWAAAQAGDRAPGPEDFDDHLLGRFVSRAALGAWLLAEIGLGATELPSVFAALRPFADVDAEGWVRALERDGEILVLDHGGRVVAFWAKRGRRPPD